jgi:thiosulfate/3-mercaptopyruvate sulfurtransferase
MNAKWFLFFLTIVPFCFGTAWARDVPAVVSTEWLAQNRGNSKIIILDIRAAAQYAKGHIPGAINTPFSLWAISNNGLSLELPSDAGFLDLLQKSGINDASIIVVVNRNETDFNRADATRVAWTCSLAGIKNIAVLDGGYNKWVKDGKTISADAVLPQPAAKPATINRSLVASKNYVLSKIEKSILLDARNVEDYFGITSKPGHIKSAVNLPVRWAFSDEGTYLKEEDLRAMAAGVLGADKSKEVIVYCGVGGFASTWWFLLTQMLGYQNVRLYDGSMEEWIQDPEAPVSTYRWN